MGNPKMNHVPGEKTKTFSGKKIPRPWTPEFWEDLKKMPFTGSTPEEPGYILTPESLWAFACEYFGGGSKDIMMKKDFIRSGEAAGKVVDLPTERPFSWTSLTLFLAYKGVRRSLNDIRTNRDNKYNEFVPVIQAIGDVIYQQKFDGAAIGGYNPQLIIRDLGLAEKVDAKLQQEQPLFVDTPQPPVEEG